MLTRVAGGLRAYSTPHGEEIAPLGEGAAAPQEAEEPAGPEQPQGDVWRAVLDPDTNLLRYEHSSGRVQQVRPRGARVVVERVAVRAARAVCAEQPLFEESEDEEERAERQRGEE